MSRWRLLREQCTQLPQLVKRSESMSEETNGQANGSVPEVELIIKVRTNRDVIAEIKCVVLAAAGRAGTTVATTWVLRQLSGKLWVAHLLCGGTGVCRAWREGAGS